MVSYGKKFRWSGVGLCGGEEKVCVGFRACVEYTCEFVLVMRICVNMYVLVGLDGVNLFYFFILFYNNLVFCYYIIMILLLLYYYFLYSN